MTTDSPVLFARWGLIQVSLALAAFATLRHCHVGNYRGVCEMSVHTWAQEQLQHNLHSASAAGYEPALALRALLSAVVEQSKSLRSPADLAQELQFLADNLDDDRDYSFMRP